MASELAKHTERIAAAIPPGTIFARVAGLMGATGGDLESALPRAVQYRLGGLEHELTIRAAMDPGTTTDGAWAQPLVSSRVSEDFIAAVRTASVLERLPVRRVPFSVPVPVETDTANGTFVQEGRPIPVGENAYASFAVPRLRVGVIVAFSRELIESWTAASESVVRAGLVASVASATDRAAFSFAAPVAATSPAGLLYGASEVPCSGSTPTAMAADFKAMLQNFANGGGNTESAAWVTSATSAAHLAAVRDSAGAPAFPQAGAAGGTLLGLPMLVTRNVATVGSPAESIVTLIEAGRVAVADGGVSIRVSEAATVQMRDDPVSGAAPQLSLYSNNAIAFRVLRYVNFIALDGAAVYMRSNW